MKKFVISFIVGACLFVSAYTPLSFKPNRLKTVVIDAGHGGKDPGCIGKTCMEKNVALSIAHEFASLIKTYEKDVMVIYTRNTDEFVELRERARKANQQQAHLFISIHCNAATSPDMVGGEVYVAGFEMNDEVKSVLQRENFAVKYEKDYEKHYSDELSNNPTLSNIISSNKHQIYREQSILFGLKIKQMFGSELKRSFRDVKQANFIVLTRTSMPSVLIEIGFMTNPGEESFMASEKGQTHYANTLYKAFRDYKTEIERR